MEKSRSLFQQVIGHKMLFVVFLLFPTDILAEDATNVITIADKTANENVTIAIADKTANENGTIAIADTTANENITIAIADTTANENIITSPFPASSKINADISTTSLPDATTPTILSRNLSTSGQPSVSFKEAPPVSKQELPPVSAVNLTVPEDTSSIVPSTVAVSTKEKHPHTEATEVQESKPPPVQKEVPSKVTVKPYFDSETASSPANDLGTRSQGSFSDEQSSSAIAYLKTTTSTEPKKSSKGPIPPGQAVPELTQTTETGSHYTSVTYTKNAPDELSDKSSSGGKSTIIILVIVFTILLVVGFLVFLYLRRRRHSGSTSFGSPEWAGQATLPDDTGLDKDVEQQAGSVGEGETRRGTLVTFFGKRQSRVPSIAMEDVNGKGGKEETEQLLSGKVEMGSPSEAVGDANGKVPEPLKGSSQKSPASN